MQSVLLVYCAFLTLFIVAAIHYYEEKLKDKTPDALSGNQLHYTYLQLENKRLKEEIMKLTPLQYEHKNDFGDK